MVYHKVMWAHCTALQRVCLQNMSAKQQYSTFVTTVRVQRNRSLRVYLPHTENMKPMGVNWLHGPPARYVKLRVVHAPGAFSPPPRVSNPDMHHGTCMTHAPWSVPWSLTNDYLWNRWRGKRSRHSRCMRNPQFYVSGKRPMGVNWLVRRWKTSIWQTYRPTNLIHKTTCIPCI